MERSNCSDWFTNFSMKMYLFREERVANWLSGAAEVDWLRGNEEDFLTFPETAADYGGQNLPIRA